jgi:hypothetical protein
MMTSVELLVLSGDDFSLASNNTKVPNRPIQLFCVGAEPLSVADKLNQSRLVGVRRPGEHSAALMPLRKFPAPV